MQHKVRDRYNCTLAPMKQSASTDIDIIGCDRAGTIPMLMQRRVAKSPDAVAFAEFDSTGRRDISWSDLSEIVNRYRTALDDADLARGDRVAILLPNCIDWIAFDIAAMANGLITVPLYLHDSTANIGFILAHTGVRLCLIDNPQRWARLAPSLEGLPALDAVWLRSGDDAAVPRAGAVEIRSLARILARADGDPGPLRSGPQDTATIISTSGTTGQPKGVKLSHHALLWDAEAVTEFIPPRTSDVFLSLLPLAHAFERSMGYHLAMMGGSCVVFARSIDTLRRDLLLVQPTILIAVPRLYERLSDAILKKAARSPIKKRLVDKAATVGWRLFEARHGRADPPGPVMRWLVWPMLDRFVARPVRQAFGGRLRVAVSGGAPLSTEVSQFLIGLGLPLVEGYGLTEAAPVVTATTLEDNMPGSVGRPLHGVETRITGEGELLIRSPALMQGYWQDPDRSAEAIDDDGWLHTGDIAAFHEGNLFITGRLKDLIVLSTGKNVAAAGVEAAIEADPLFEQCCAFGNAHAFVVALVVLGHDPWAGLARQDGLDADAPNSAAATAVLLPRIRRAMRDLPRFAQVRAVHAVLQPWTVEDGSLTPTLKIKRHVIEDRYRAEIAGLYEQRGSGRDRGAKGPAVPQMAAPGSPPDVTGGDHGKSR